MPAAHPSYNVSSSSSTTQGSRCSLAAPTSSGSILSVCVFVLWLKVMCRRIFQVAAGTCRRCCGGHPSSAAAHPQVGQCSMQVAHLLLLPLPLVGGAVFCNGHAFSVGPWLMAHVACLGAIAAQGHPVASTAILLAVGGAAGACQEHPLPSRQSCPLQPCSTMLQGGPWVALRGIGAAQGTAGAPSDARFLVAPGSRRTWSPKPNTCLCGVHPEGCIRPLVCSCVCR